MKPHVHAELIKKWADGVEIQFYSSEFNKWADVGRYPAWDKDIQYRVKPESKKYRVALVNGFPGCVHFPEREKAWENSRGFQRWLTDWVEYDPE